MPDAPSNVKIYDRPERKAPSPLLLALGVALLLVIAFFAYRTFFAGRSTPAAAPATPERESWRRGPASAFVASSRGKAVNVSIPG